MGAEISIINAMSEPIETKCSKFPTRCSISSDLDSFAVSQALLAGFQHIFITWGISSEERQNLAFPLVGHSKKYNWESPNKTIRIHMGA
ncbi:hypothetical protein BB560_006754 [Smittium megazygosporum]|uniref:Uncharacterized protein n=1 Tax=Smittium megazygosporum TaxID=133381 RepID=A0A2T9Y1Y3_9FUNG|nr:hypothetical protein BB560_006754 [Smittium megazygosporum]